MASRYDDEIWELAPREGGPPSEHLRAFLRSLGGARRALDLGCGDGRLTSELHAKEIVAADVSRVALYRARGRLGLRGIEFVELDPDEPLPFADAGFDLVLCVETLEHVRDVQLLLSEVRRVLRPGGRLAVATPANSRLAALDVLLRGLEARFDPSSPHLRFFTRRSLRRLLDELGFEIWSLRRRAGSLLAVAGR